MRSVVLTATLLTTLWLGLPGQASGQDPDPPPPPTQPAPPPPPPPARDVAVPRAERITVRDTESRAPDSSQENRVPRGADRVPVGDPQPANDGRRSPNAAEGSRRTPANASSTARAADEQQRSGGAERRGAVRRPPPAGSPSEGRQATRDRAVPRASVPRQPDRVYVYPDYYRNYNRYYDPWGYGGFGLGYFYYSPWGWDPGYSGSSYGYGSAPRYSPFGYDIGSIKLKVKPRDAEVFVDGYFAGYVDDFDGIFQALKLDRGGYRIEIRKPGYETLHFDVRVQPERAITFRGELKPVP